MTTPKRDDLWRRSMTATGWNVAANTFKLVIFFIRTTLLARLIPDAAVWGTYATALAWIELTLILPNFGMAGAFLHRAPETEDEDEAAAVHFTLKSVFTLIWAAVLGGTAVILTDGSLQFAFLVLIAARGFNQAFSQTPKHILVRRVIHRRLSLIEFTRAVIIVVFSLGLAYRGYKIEALVYPTAVATLSDFILLYFWRPVWRPRFAWSPPIVRYYLDFGRKNMAANGLLKLLDRVDDLFTNTFLGREAMGYYSRAYAYATYPRQVLAIPINRVVSGSYAELKEQRQALSQMFFRVNALLIRSGFFIAGWFALIAPEFIRLAPGAAWLPILDAFRLMLVFTLLDPLKITVSHLFLAVGKPTVIVKARVVQLGVLAAGLFLLGLPLGIRGVALAVDVMLFVGIFILLRQARAYVDFSPRRLFVNPSLMLAAAALGTMEAARLTAVPNDWLSLGLKTAVFTPIYLLLWLVLEREQFKQVLGYARTAVHKYRRRPHA